MKAKDILLLNNTITQNPILARTAWFWHVASQYLSFIIISGGQTGWSATGGHADI